MDDDNLERFLLNKNVSVSYREGFTKRVLKAIVVGHDKNFVYFQNELGSITSINKFSIVTIVEAAEHGK